MQVAVLGLGEAGSAIAAGLAAAGDEVRGFDPAPVRPLGGVTVHDDPRSAAAGCELVMAVVPSAAAPSLLEEVSPALDEVTVYADLCTGSPGLKRMLADVVGGRGALFADVALMAPVPGRGLATPAMVSGTGAARYGEMLNARGGAVEVIGEEAGEAAARKLLRSVMMKGLAGLLIESMEAATRLGQGEWFWSHLSEQLGSIDETLMHRLLSGTAAHAGRRVEEMEAARTLLDELEVPPTMTDATLALLRRVAAGGLPDVVTGSYG
jgi:3-hydroxyisobutyrate dehydrogenase-like beta-hydroxyacid dehydrogenase